MTDGGEGATGHKANRIGSKRTYTLEQRQQMALAVPNRCEVLCVETDEVFPSFAAAAKILDISYGCISKAVKDIKYTAGGYHRRLIKSSEMQSTNKKKAVRCIETGEIFPSIRAAAKWVGVNKSLIGNVISNQTLSASGYHFELVEDYYKDYESRLPGIPRAVICIETHQVFPMIKSAAAWANINCVTISAVLAGRMKTAGGYHWRYADKNDQLSDD